MDFSKFFYMAEGGEPNAFNLNCSEGMTSELAFDLLRGTAASDQPLVLEVESGSRVADALTASFVDIRPFSEHFFRVLLDNHITGWSSYPLEIRGSDGSNIEGYRGLVVTGRCGPIDKSKSKTEMRPPRGPRGRPMAKLIGMFFDPLSWDGSDIFHPDGSGHIIVSNDAKLALERAKLTGITFRSLNEQELGFA